MPKALFLHCQTALHLLGTEVMLRAELLHTASSRLLTAARGGQSYALSCSDLFQGARRTTAAVRVT